MQIQARHEYGRTPRGLIQERYVPLTGGMDVLTRDLEFVILAGCNVAPGKIEERVQHFSSEKDLEASNYFGAFPAILAYRSQRSVRVVYQAGVSGRQHRKGFYSQKTSELQLQEALATSPAEKVYPITHSLSSLTGLDIVTGAEYARDPRLMAGTISSIFTNAEDALTYQGVPRTLLSIPWISLMRSFQDVDLTLPLYPLADQFWHDGNHKEIFGREEHGALRKLNLKSAAYLLTGNGLVKAQQPAVKNPLLIITREDEIFSASEQVNVAAALDAERLEIPAGHRWFTNTDFLPYLAKRITLHAGVVIRF